MRRNSASARSTFTVTNALSGKVDGGSPSESAKTDMPKPIRLLWVFSTFAVGGPQRRMATLTGSLGEGYEHLVLAMDGRYDAEEVLPKGIAYRRVEAEVQKGGFISRANIRTFREVTARENADLLLTSNWGAIEWLFANRGRRAIPQIHFEDGFGPDERPDAQNPKRVWVRRLMFRRKALEFVAPSQVLEKVYSETWKVKPARVHLIPNGVDLEAFSATIRPQRPVTIGTVAALRREKRLDRLIECFAALPDQTAQLLIVGGGPERDALEAQAKSLGGRVRFAGEQSDVAPFLNDMDIYALSSDTEQMPISLVEGMASGLPVAATNVGDVASMVCDANRAHVVPLGDDAALTNAMAKLCSDASLRAELGAANSARAKQHYGLQAMTDAYDALFKRLAASR